MTSDDWDDNNTSHVVGEVGATIPPSSRKWQLTIAQHREKSTAHRNYGDLLVASVSSVSGCGVRAAANVLQMFVSRVDALIPMCVCVRVYALHYMYQVS